MTAVEFAAHFVATQEDGAERILRRHHSTPNGLCAGCLATPVAYPCQAAQIAEAVQHAGRADPRRPPDRSRS